jgi:hypothetical protein
MKLRLAAPDGKNAIAARFCNGNPAEDLAAPNDHGGALAGKIESSLWRIQMRRPRREIRLTDAGRSISRDLSALKGCEVACDGAFDLKSGETGDPSREEYATKR